MARSAERMHGARVAVIGMVIALIFREGGDPTWFDIAGFAGMLPAGLFGGHLALQRRERAGTWQKGSDKVG